MKRIFSMALVLIMALTLISAVGVTAYAVETTGGTNEGTVIVYKQDFEADVLPTTWTSNNEAQFGVSLGTDSTGNRYVKAGSWKADNLATRGATWAQGADGTWATTGNYRISAEAIQGRVSDSTNTVELKNGKSYNYTWDGIAQGNGEVKSVSFGSSGINALVGGQFLAYNTNGDGGIKGTIGQLYGTGQGWTTPTAQTMKSVTKTALGNGWYSAGYKGLAYPLVKSKDDHTAVDSVKINGFFYQCETPVGMIRDLLVSEKAYCGSGFTDCAAYTFEITKEDLYGDEAKVDKTGKVWTEDELCRTWKLSEDCTPLYSEQRIAAFQKALDEADIQYGIDNITISADAMLYNDTVTVTGADATVKAVTNTYTGESQTINGSGTITNVNDYYGTAYTVTTAAEGVSATYNGEAVAVSGSNGTYTFTIAPEKVTKNGELVITALSKVVVFYDDAEDRSADWSTSNQGSISFDVENGNTVAVLSGWDTTRLVSSYVNKGTTTDYYPRVQYKHSDNSIIKGTKYTLSYKYKYMDGATVLSNISQNQIFLNIANSLTVQPSGWAVYPAIGSGNVKQMYVSKAGTEGADGWRAVSADITLTGIDSQFGAGDDIDSTQISNMQAELKGFNHAAGNLINEATKAAVEANTADGTVDQAAAAKALATELAKHDYKMYVDEFKLEALTVAVPVSISADNASVKVNGVSITDGSSIKVGKDYTTAIKIKVDEGYELESVKINGEVQSFTAGEDVVIIKNVFSEAADVEIIAKAEYVAPSVSVTEGKPGKNYSYNGETYPYTVIMYGKVTGDPTSYGFKLEKDGKAVLLASEQTSVDGVFAIRVVGDGITPGSYIATPFWVDGEEQTGSGSEIEITE